MYKVPLNAANMCCFYWLMNKAVLAYDRAEYSQLGNPNRYREKAGEVKETPRAAGGTRWEVTSHESGNKAEIYKVLVNLTVTVSQ